MGRTSSLTVAGCRSEARRRDDRWSGRTSRVLPVRRTPFIGPSGGRVALAPELVATGVIAVGRRLAPAAIADIAQALIQGGVLAFELTLNTPATSALAAIKPSRDQPSRWSSGLGRLCPST